MKALAKMQKIHQLNETAARQLLALEIHELKRFGVINIGVLDANGVLKYRVGMNRSVGKDFSQQKYYQAARNQTAGERMITEFINFTGAPEGPKGILIAVPMLTTAAVKRNTGSAEQFAGVVFCTVELETIIQKFVSSIRSSKKGHTFLIDDKYTVLWAPDQALFGKNFWQVAEEFPSFQEVLQRMAAGDSGTPEFLYYRFDESTKRYSKKSGEHDIAYVPVQIGQMRWSIAVWAPREEAKNLIQPGYVNQLLLMGLVIMIILTGPAYSLIAAFRYSKSLEKKVEKKTEEIRTAHQRLLTVLNSLDAAVYVVDMNSYEILFINKYLRDVFGDVTGKVCWQVLQKGKYGSV